MYAFPGSQDPGDNFVTLELLFLYLSMLRYCSVAAVDSWWLVVDGNTNNQKPTTANKIALRWLLRRGSPLPIPNREVKPACADGTAICGRVCRCLSLIWTCFRFFEPQSEKIGVLFFIGAAQSMRYCRWLFLIWILEKSLFQFDCVLKFVGKICFYINKNYFIVIDYKTSISI